MDDVVEAVLAYLEAVQPLPDGTPTAAVLAGIRARLDVARPGWREAVYRDAAPGADRTVEVEFRFRGGRVVRGALHQRPSAVGGDEQRAGR